MTITKHIILMFSVAVLFSGCYARDMDEIRERGVIVVSMDLETPGYFTLGGENHGYLYDLLKSYADNLGVELIVDNSRNPTQRKHNFQRAEIDIIATMPSYISPEDKEHEIPLFSTVYVVLAQKNKATLKASTLIGSFSGSRILISSGFKNSLSYCIMVDSLTRTEIWLSPLNSFELVEELSGGHFDYLICEQGEAHVACALVGNIKQVYQFEEQIYVSTVINPRDVGLKEDFEQWLDNFMTTDEYAILNYLYFEKGIAGRLITSHNSDQIEGGISIYDTLMRRLSQSEGYDWRLIAAMAYTESRFNPYIISRRGARGLMQVRPIVARQFHVRESDIMKPETNITLALRLLRKNEQTLKIPASTPFNDKMKIVLASYNAGVGHVGDARRLATKNGEDPNSWDVVANYLRLKSDTIYAEDEVVSSGRFTGSRETLSYVDKVMAKYATYVKKVAREPVD